MARITIKGTRNVFVLFSATAAELRPGRVLDAVEVEAYYENQIVTPYRTGDLRKSLTSIRTPRTIRFRWGIKYAAAVNAKRPFAMEVVQRAWTKVSRRIARGQRLFVAWEGPHGRAGYPGAATPPLTPQ